MFTPYFTITPKITKHVEAIGAVFGYFRAIQIPEGYRRELVSKVTAETVHSSTAIEGNTLTEQQVGDLLQGKTIHLGLLNRAGAGKGAYYTISEKGAEVLIALQN